MVFFRVESDRITNWHSINYNFRWSKHFIKAFEVHCNLGVIVSKWLFSIVTLPLLLWGCLATCEWPGSSDREALDCWAEWLLKWISDCVSECFLVDTTLEVSETTRWLVSWSFVTLQTVLHVLYWPIIALLSATYCKWKVLLIRSHWKYERYERNSLARTVHLSHFQIFAFAG